MKRYSEWDFDSGVLRPFYRFGLIENLARPMARQTADPDDDYSIWLENVMAERDNRSDRGKRKGAKGLK